MPRRPQNRYFPSILGFGRFQLVSDVSVATRRRSTWVKRAASRTAPLYIGQARTGAAPARITSARRAAARSAIAATGPPTFALANEVFGHRDAPVVVSWIFAGHQVGGALAAFGAGAARSVTVNIFWPSSPATWLACWHFPPAARFTALRRTSVAE